MSRLEKYVPNRAGIRAILKSGPVDAVLLRIGEKVKSAAEAQGQIMERSSPGDRSQVPLRFRVVNTPTHVRSRVRVIADHPGALNAERKHHILFNALRSAG